AVEAGSLAGDAPRTENVQKRHAGFQPRRGSNVDAAARGRVALVGGESRGHGNAAVGLDPQPAHDARAQVEAVELQGAGRAAEDELPAGPQGEPAARGSSLDGGEVDVAGARPAV